MGSKQRLSAVVLMLLVLGTMGCGQEAAENQAVKPDGAATEDKQASQPVKGQAAWYGPGYYGSKTTSGEILKKGTMTAAHSSLPMGTKVKVTRLDNNKSITVVINDRKPFKQGTVIDLAHGSATALNVHEDGKATVEIQVIDE